jgi:hypothetical protein
MRGQETGPGARSGTTARNVVMALLGAAVLVLTPAYDGPFGDVLRSYGGNIAVSFALYFAVLNASARYRRPRLLAASATLLAVELFEATDGFGILANTFDTVDFVANAAGVGLAVVVDVVTTPLLSRHRKQATTGSDPPE